MSSATTSSELFLPYEKGETRSENPKIALSRAYEAALIKFAAEYDAAAARKRSERSDPAMCRLTTTKIRESIEAIKAATDRTTMFEAEASLRKTPDGEVSATYKGGPSVDWAATKKLRKLIKKRSPSLITQQEASAELKTIYVFEDACKTFSRAMTAFQTPHIWHRSRDSSAMMDLFVKSALGFDHSAGRSALRGLETFVTVPRDLLPSAEHAKTAADSLTACQSHLNRIHALDGGFDKSEHQTLAQSMFPAMIALKTHKQAYERLSMLRGELPWTAVRRAPDCQTKLDQFIEMFARIEDSQGETPRVQGPPMTRDDLLSAVTGAYQSLKSLSREVQALLELRGLDGRPVEDSDNPFIVSKDLPGDLLSTLRKLSEEITSFGSGGESTLPTDQQVDALAEILPPSLRLLGSWF